MFQSRWLSLRTVVKTVLNFRFSLTSRVGLRTPRPSWSSLWKLRYFYTLSFMENRDVSFFKIPKKTLYFLIISNWFFNKCWIFYSNNQNFFIENLEVLLVHFFILLYLSYQFVFILFFDIQVFSAFLCIFVMRIQLLFDSKDWSDDVESLPISFVAFPVSFLIVSFALNSFISLFLCFIVVVVMFCFEILFIFGLFLYFSWTSNRFLRRPKSLKYSRALWSIFTPYHPIFLFRKQNNNKHNIVIHK